MYRTGLGWDEGKGKIITAEIVLRECLQQLLRRQLLVYWVYKYIVQPKSTYHRIMKDDGWCMDCYELFEGVWTMSYSWPLAAWRVLAFCHLLLCTGLVYILPPWLGILLQIKPCKKVFWTNKINIVSICTTVGDKNRSNNWIIKYSLLM